MTEPARADRLALVGANSPVGKELKHRLAVAGYPGRRIELFDLDEEVGLVTDYGDEARVILEAARDELARFRIACFCGGADATRKLAPTIAEAGGIAIDCTDRWPEEIPLAGPGSTPESGVVAIPHPAVLLLARLSRAVPLAGAAATLLLPASERTEDGAETLARQATDLLTFGAREDEEAEQERERDPIRRLAFDLWPVEPEAVDRLRGQLMELELEPPSLAVFRTSVFHGLALSLWIPGHSPEQIRLQLAEQGLESPAVEAGDDRIDSPARAAESDLAGPHVSGLRGDGDGSWLWAVQDNYQATASAAVEIVSLHLDPETESVN